MDTCSTRRQLIGGSVRLALALACGVPLLQACGDSAGGGTKRAAGIKDGLKPEAGPLKIFNFKDYVNPEVVSAFEAKYGVKVDITTFNSDDEAVTKLASGAVEIDLHHSAATATLYKLVDSGLIQPLNKTYLTNVGNIDASLRDPGYDKGNTYTVPYTVFSTGIGFRADKVDAAKVGWDTLWDPTYKGVASVLDDVREGLTMAMMHKGLTDVNTTDPAVIKQAGADLGELTNLMNIKVEIEGYHTIPEGATSVAHTWSGDMLTAIGYLPEGTGSDVLGYWAPAPSVVDNDLICVTSKAKNPVLAHLYIDFLLDKANAETNFTFVGYQPAIEGLGADELIGKGLVPENLRTCVLSTEQIAKGLRHLRLSPDVETLWEDAWSKFKAGG
jgi:spermidine/putrescine transport system substrate-binding protein